MDMYFECTFMFVQSNFDRSMGFQELNTYISDQWKMESNMDKYSGGQEYFQYDRSGNPREKRKNTCIY